MRVIVYVCLLATAATAAKLQNNYLPPASAQSSAGSSRFLSLPRRTFSGFPTSSASLFPHPGTETSYAAPPSGPVPAGLYTSPARTYPTGTPIAILKYNNENNGDGNYRFEYQTENKISQQEQGHVQNAGSDQASIIVHGSYSYEAPDGQTITVTYEADETGFKASGDHIPTPPPIPAAIQKSLEVTRTAGYSTSSSFSGGVSSSSSSFGSIQHQPQGTTRQYLAPTTQPTGGYRY